MQTAWKWLRVFNLSQIDYMFLLLRCDKIGFPYKSLSRTQRQSMSFKPPPPSPPINLEYMHKFHFRVILIITFHKCASLLLPRCCLSVTSVPLIRKKPVKILEKTFAWLKVEKKSFFLLYFCIVCVYFVLKDKNSFEHIFRLLIWKFSHNLVFYSLKYLKCNRVPRLRLRKPSYLT